jgi:hypothetical protein
MTMVSQHFDNPALFYLAMLSLPDHAAQFYLQRQQPFDLGFDICQHIARNAIDAFTGLVGPVRQLKKFPNHSISRHRALQLAAGIMPFRIENLHCSTV